MNILISFKQKGILRTINEFKWSLRKVKFFWLLLHINWVFSKWVFQKPKKKDILIYDAKMSEVIFLLLKKESCEILHVRYESINLHVIFKTLFNTGLKNFKNNYKLNFLNLVSPKIVITCIDNNMAFYKLKDLYDNAKYICIQLSNRSMKFSNECANYYKNNTERLKADYIFIIGESYKKIFAKVIDSKIFCLGSIKNNYYYIKNKKVNEGKKSILFISQVYPASSYQRIRKEAKIFKSLNDYCIKKNYELNLCSKNKASHINFYQKNFTKKNWNYFPRRNQGSSYEIVNESDVIVFTNSTLGLEALAKKKRCISFPPDGFPIRDFIKQYPENGPFWFNDFNNNKMEEYIEKVVSYKDAEWAEIVNKNVDDIMMYDEKNTKFFEIINDLIDKNLTTNKPI